MLSAVDAVRFHELPPVERGSWHGAPEGTIIGHVHFYIGELERAAQFYRDGLGFDVVTWRYPGALFVSAGGYHHHVGLNVWAANSPQASAKDARLLHWELLLPSGASVKETLKSLQTSGYSSSQDDTGKYLLSDPWGITVALVESK